MNERLRLHFCLVLLLPFVGHAQTPSSENKLRIGLETGINFAFLDRFGPYKHDDPSANFLRVRLGCSAFFAYQLLPGVRLQTGIGYANYGGQFREEAGTVYTPASSSPTRQSTKSTYYFKDIYRMDFLEIPLMAKFFILPKKKISPYLTAGMSYGILLRASNYYNFNDVNTMQMDDITPYTKGNFVNYIFGAGIEFLRHKKVSLGVDMRYHRSLTHVFAYPKLDFAYPDPEDENSEYVATYNVDAYYHNLFISFFTSFNF